MPRKPNYKFERMERDRAKALKKASRLEAKKEKAGQQAAEASPEAAGASQADDDANQ